MLAGTVGRDDQHNPPAMFDDDEQTVMVPTFSEGSFFADRYLIESLLGSGAMGRVYAASELHSGRRVALKVLHKERLAEAETVARFKREAEVLASIGHPCIVQIYTFHHTPDGTPYLAMELLEGVTLKTRLQTAGRFEDARNFQEILDGIAGALDAAHSRGVVHRDMKPDNVFLLATGEPRAKLVDFGLSRIAKADKSLTHSGMILGTPRYMAPEQIRDAASAGPSVDIYSLGVLLYESLAGQSPYPAQDYGQLLGCVMEGRTTPLEEVRPDLAHVAPVVSRSLHPDPSQRFRSCGELADAYGAALGIPSKRREIDARHTPEPARPRRASMASIPVNKGSTLAFDVNAMGGLPDLPSAAPAQPEEPLAPPPPVWDREPSASVRVHPDASWDAPTSHLPMEGAPAPFGHGETTEPTGDPHGSSSGMAAHAGPPSPAAYSPAPQPLPGPSYGSHRPPPPAASSPAGPPAGRSPQDQSPQFQSQGGDTMFLPSAGQAPGAPPSFPPAPGASPGAWSTPGGMSPAPQASFAGGPAAGVAPSPDAQPKKRKGCGVALFLIAMIVVVAVSAAGGLALRAYTRGQLDLPFEIPGLEPGEPPADDATADN